MEHTRKPKADHSLQGWSSPTERPRLKPAATTPGRRTELRADLARFTTRPVVLQRQVVGPVLRALDLHAEEVNRPDLERQTLQGQLAGLGPTTPGEVEAASRRRAERETLPAPSARPQTPGEWVAAMRYEAAATEGQWLDTRRTAQFTGLQRQVAQTLAQGFRADRGSAEARYETYGAHLAALGQHPLSAPVARVVLGLVPPGERPSLQRAADAASQQEAAQQARDAGVLQAYALQRQLAELDARATQPILKRIEARRGAGQPLPGAVRRHLEQGLNHDLSRVRVHDDAEADTLVRSVSAVAFTTGTDIFFRSGKYSPNTQSGLELLAHEVAHTVQQAQGRVETGIDPDAGLETEARAVGRRLADLRPVGGTLAARRMMPHAPLMAGLAVQRQATGGGGSGGVQSLAQAIGAGDLERALKLLRGMKREQQAQAMMEMMRRFRGKMGPGVAEGLQAMIDGLSKRIPEAIKKTVKKPVQPGPWNPPGQQPIPYYIGTSAHNAIAQHYEAVHAGERVFTNTRPLSTVLGRTAGKLTQAERLLKPDIVNLDRRHLYEIKSRSQAGLAVAEAAMYLALFRKAGVKMDLGPVNDPGVIGIIPAPGGHYAFQAIAPGAVVYDYRRGRYDPKGVPVPVPVPVPAPETDQERTPAPVPATSAPVLPESSDPAFLKRMSELTGLTGVALIIYLILSEGSRLFPPRNLVPIL